MMCRTLLVAAPHRTVGWLVLRILLLLALGLLAASAQHASAQNASAQNASADTSATDAENVGPRPPARVYIDCERCDYNYIRREITFVSYVRSPDQANVHVFITSVEMGDGGREYEISFLGRRSFAGTNYAFTHRAGRDETSDQEREGLNRVLELGLLPYALKTGEASSFSLSYEAEEDSSSGGTGDAWNHWVFNVYAGRLETDIETNQTSFDSRWGFYADRVTRTWKVRMRPYFNFEFVRIDQEGEEAISSRRHRHGVNSFAIRSVSEHWSVGYFGDYLTRNDRNIEHRYRVNPGLEYSLLPYSVATRRAITFRYRVGYTQANYYEETIFGKARESLVNQQLEASVYVRQPWGSIDVSLVGSHYFHDFTQRRAEFYSQLSVRVTEGLAVNFGMDFEMIQDQLSLPRGDASVEDILLEQRELATDFQFEGSISLSYTFGSPYASIVNTRF